MCLFYVAVFQGRKRMESLEERKEGRIVSERNWGKGKKMIQISSITFFVVVFYCTCL